MLTSYPDEEAVLSAIVAGASGYLLKQIRARDLVAALESVGRGESLLDPAVTEKVLERVRRIATGAYTDEMAQLTAQEQRILLLVAEGKTNKEIASRGLPVRQDGEELRELDPLQAQPRAARPGRRLRRQAPAGPRRGVGPLLRRRRPARRVPPRRWRTTSSPGAASLRIETRGRVTGRPAQRHGRVRRAPGRRRSSWPPARPTPTGRLNLLAEPACRVTIARPSREPPIARRARRRASTRRPSAT